MTHQEYVTLRDFLEDKIKGLQQELAKLEDRVDERLKVYKENTEYRLIHLNELRDLVNKIMSEHVTHKELDLILAPIKEANAHRAGEKEVSNKWLYVLVVVVPIIVNLIFRFAV